MTDDTSRSASRRNISWSTPQTKLGDARACRRASWPPPRRRPAGRSWANSCSRRSRSVTLPHTDIKTARAGAAPSAPDGRQGRGRARARHPRRRHAPDRGLGQVAAIRGRTLRRGDGRSADDRPAQHAVRPARACRIARSGRSRRRDDAHAALSAAVHRARHVVAVLALAADRAQGLPARGLRRTAAHRRARAVPQQGRVRRLRRGAGEGRRDAGFELHLVVDPALAQASDAGAARARLPDAGRRLDRDRRALALAGAPADAQSAAQPRHQRGGARDRGREQMARAALRRARHASSATTARSRSPT